MTRTKDVKETGRYGPRYGMTLRRRTLKILRKRYQRSMCARCGKKTLFVRKSVGVWRCPHCEYVFAGPAHVPSA